MLPLQTQNVIALTRAVALQSVRVMRSATRLLGIRAGDVMDNLAVVTKAGGLKSPDAPQTVRAFVSLECTLKTRGGEREVAKVECDMILDYAVTDADLFGRLTDEECMGFAGLNGVYNAWPYLREFCQSASLRMGLPTPILIPTLPPSQHTVTKDEGEPPAPKTS